MVEQLEKKIEKEFPITVENIKKYALIAAGAAFLPSFLYTTTLSKYTHDNILVDIGVGIETFAIATGFGVFMGVCKKYYSKKNEHGNEN